MPIGAAESVIPQCDGPVAPDGITSGHIDPRYGGGKVERRREARGLRLHVVHGAAPHWCSF